MARHRLTFARASCHTQFSRYTCPKCNFHYCSLACFRCQSHERCSEAFDRQSLLDEIHLDQTKNQQEKKAMLDMLRKFEQESLLEQEQEQDDTDDADQVDLESKLQGVDLGEHARVLAIFARIHVAECSGSFF